jgi:hypothetical protein
MIATPFFWITYGALLLFADVWSGPELLPEENVQLRLLSFCKDEHPASRSIIRIKYELIRYRMKRTPTYHSS